MGHILRTTLLDWMRKDSKQRDDHMNPHEKQRTKEDIINFIIGLYIYIPILFGGLQNWNHTNNYIYIYFMHGFNKAGNEYACIHTMAYTTCIHTKIPQRVYML